MSNRWITSSLLAVATAYRVAQPARAQDSPSERESDKQRIERLEATVADLSRRLSEREAHEQAVAQQR
ncbi:MAG: hypothetical protein ACJ8AT_27125, partial [Hyalangium sp.]|uniref:hypothetical protein n=1 Tax=Hyalangium sp. TaxID=2028555 RepID=UPI003899E5BB